jgi:tetratricopeptide (TPR) repeat protein
MGYSLLKTLAAIETNAVLRIALSDLVNLRLIKKEEDSKRYTVHRLLAKVRQFEKPLKDRQEWHKKIVKRLERWFRNKHEESKILTEAEIELDHLETWHRRTLECLPAETVWLSILKAYSLFERGNYREALKYVEEAKEIYTAENLTDKLLLIHIYNAFGMSYNYLGNYEECRTHVEKAISFYKENLFDDKKLLARLTNGLGVSYSNSSNHQKALELFQQVLEIRQELFTENHPDLAVSLNNLGVAYYNSGEYQKALELFQQALEMQQALFGKKHPLIALSLNNFGVSYHHLENWNKAIELYELALEMRRELLGEQHPNTIKTCTNLITALSKTGKNEDAKKLADEFLSYVPQNHPDRKFFEKHAAPYQKPLKKKKRRGK